MKQIITSLLYLLIIFSVSQFIFEPTHLYYELRWLDIPMHLMGGFGIASLVAAILGYYKKPAHFWYLFGTYVVVAIAWELYEYAHDLMIERDWNGWFDTSKDFINGALGAWIAYLLIRK